MIQKDAAALTKRALLRVARGCIYRRNLVDDSVITSCEKTYFTMPQSSAPYPDWCPNCGRNVAVFPCKEALKP